MTYSVWNYSRKAYDYYSAPSIGGTHAGAPPPPALRHVIGATPEGAAWKVPWGAKRVGSGPLPRGRIATNEIALGDLASDLPRLGLVAGLVYLAWRTMR